MGLRRYYATADNTITNAYKSNLTTRGVSGNMGQSDILEVFSIYGQVSSSDGLSKELTRFLIKFDTTQIASDRSSGVIPASGSVSFFLKMYDAPHTQTTPKDFNLSILPVSRSWAEGLGLDMENYTDLDSSNWLSSSGATQWTSEGGDYIDDISSSFSASFSTGFENLDVDVTTLVEQWVDSGGNVLGSKNDYGFGVSLVYADEEATDSYYTKMFFGRASQYILKRPTLEARWDSTKKDNRSNFMLSSSLVPADNNLMKLYLYNIVRGQLTNIPAVGTGEMEVSIYSGTLLNTAPTGSKIGLALGGGTVAAGQLNTTASYVETGIYSCSFAYTASSITTIFDVWHSGGVQYHTGTAIEVNTYDSVDYNYDQKYVSKVVNLRSTYARGETARFRLYTRKKDWNPTIYTVSNNAIETSIVDDVYYKIVRLSDQFEVIPFGTGSLNYTRLSYDASGSYFDLKMDLFAVDTVYEMSMAYKINGIYVEQPERYKFRVE